MAEYRWVAARRENSPHQPGREGKVAQRRSGHVTLLDIARACGFSVSTVSIVLSEAPLSRNVAASTRQQIRAMAQTLGYHPDAYARSLRRRRSQTIGVLAYDLSDPFCIPIVRGIQAGLQPASFLPLLMDAQTERDLFDSYLQMILERRAEGVIVIASWVFDETNLLGDIEKNNVPIVIVSRDMSSLGISSVLVDNQAGGAMALRHLLQLGHRRIAVIRGPEELFDSAPRWAGVRAAAAEAGIDFHPRLVLQLPALGVVRGLAAAGVRVPEDCSVLGFDDVQPAAVATPGITTIRQPTREMGLLAAKWVLEGVAAREQGGALAPRLHLAQPQLVARMSTTCPPLQQKHRRAGAKTSLTRPGNRDDISRFKRLN